MMPFRLLLICAGACVAYAGSESTPAPHDGPVVTTAGGTFLGSWMESRHGRRFQAYRGIRYAEPPTGELRFQSPVDMTSYPSAVPASEDGPACPEPTDNLTYPMDEDCLRLNVYTPRNNSTKLPIIVYIHSGGLYSMSGRSDLAGPHYLLDRDIVLITMNYRLSSLGFLSTGDAVAPGNNGFKDQVSALRWVQRFGGAFGGDVTKVTIAGCSAGSLSVQLHMVSPMSKGLFHRGISISGAPPGKSPQPHDLRALASKQARLLNCSDHSSQAIVDCLKTKSWRDIANSLLGFWDQFGYDPIWLFRPVVERDFGQQRFLTEDPVEAITAGRLHAVPFIISQTEGEFFWKAYSVTENQTLIDTMNAEWERVAPVAFDLPPKNVAVASRRLKEVYLHGKDVANDTDTNERLGKLYGDSIIGFSVHSMANLMCRRSSQPVWYYLFNYIGNHSHYESSETGKPIEAAHHDDLIYLFSLSYRFPAIPAATSNGDGTLVDRMTAIWATFAKHGDPNPRGDEFPELSGVSWPAMTPQARNYLHVDKEFSVREKLHEQQLRVWEELYPMQY